MSHTKKGTYRPHERIFTLLANLMQGPSDREGLIELDYPVSEAGNKLLRRDMKDAAMLGYPVIRDPKTKLYRIDFDHLVKIALGGEDLTLLRLAVSQLHEKKGPHQVARHMLSKLLGTAELADDAALSVRVELGTNDLLLQIIDAIDHRATLDFDYDAASHESRSYRVEPCWVWRMGRAYYLAARRIAVGPSLGELVECEPEPRTFRLARITAMTVGEPGSYSIELTGGRQYFEPVEAAVHLAPGVGGHLRERFGAADDAEQVTVSGLNTADFIDEMNLLGAGAWTDEEDYCRRLTHLAQLEDR
ncbi:MAG: WYL domain-containing protein [Flaviflexus sp.]|nr:WYL domain-containing protein [Flaviflexus sp.]